MRGELAGALPPVVSVPLYHTPADIAELAPFVPRDQAVGLEALAGLVLVLAQYVSS